MELKELVITNDKHYLKEKINPFSPIKDTKYSYTLNEFVAKFLYLFNFQSVFLLMSRLFPGSLLIERRKNTLKIKQI